MVRWESVSFDDTNAVGTYDRSFEWSYRDNSYEWEMQLPRSVYEIHSRRHRVYDYGIYIADGTTQSLFEGFCETVESIATDNGFDAAEKAAFVARFVQSLPYTLDSVSTGYDNYPRYPIETLVDETGDCEDASVLLATLLYGLGYPVALVEFDSHLGVAVAVPDAPGNVEIDGREYSYIEATSTGWNIGELPPSYRGESIDLHYVEDSPTLYVSWRGLVDGGSFSVAGSVYNHGMDTAESVQVYVTLETPGEETVAGVTERWNRIPADAEVEFSATVPVDHAGLVRPVWVVAVDDQVHDRGEATRKRI